MANWLFAQTTHVAVSKSKFAAGWPPVYSSIFQVLLKSVQWFCRCGWSKIALPHYFGHWLIQQLVLLYNPWYWPMQCNVRMYSMLVLMTSLLNESPTHFDSIIENALPWVMGHMGHGSSIEWVTFVMGHSKWPIAYPGEYLWLLRQFVILGLCVCQWQTHSPSILSVSACCECEGSSSWNLYKNNTVCYWRL